jgi:hypothetical protein
MKWPGRDAGCRAFEEEEDDDAECNDSRKNDTKIK